MREGLSFLRDAPVPQVASGPRPEPRPGSWVPGEAGLWVFILGDMLMFGVFFAAFLVTRAQHPSLFARSRASMTVAFGATNTIVLLTSSLFVASAVRAFRAGRRRDARRLVGLAGGCAATFAAIKLTEWGIKLSDGDTPGTNLYFTFYYLLTAVHFLHLLIGSVVLFYLYRLLGRAPDPGRDERRIVESCASYWHMVDLLWLVLFPILYLSAT